MTSFSRSASLLIARATLVVVVLSFAAFGTWTAGGLFGQPPTQKKQRVEEEEEAPKAKKPKRKVIQVEDEEDPKAKAKSDKSRPVGPAPSGDLAQLAEQAPHPAVKALFSSLAVPHDVVSYKPSSVTVSGERRPEEKIVPTPFYLGNDPGRYRREFLSFTRLTLDWKQEPKSHAPFIETLQSVRPYEEIAQDKVRRFLRENYQDLSRYDMLAAAEQVLSFVLKWHKSAIQTGERKGNEWDEVGKVLRKQLLDEVLLEQMKVLAQAKNWDEVLKLTHRLAVTYGKDAEYERIFQPVADMMKSTLNPSDPTGSEEKRQKARERLHELEMEFPDQKAFRPLSEMLRQQAKDLLDKAKTQAEAKNNAGARGFLLQAKKTWPQLPELRRFEAELNNDYPILHVGVRGPLPRYFSPALACTDNERRAVEMLFESLVKLVPDGSGGFRYGRGLALSSPKVVPLGRLFHLPHGAVWSDGGPLTSNDVKFSLDQFRYGMGVGRSRAWGDLLAEVEMKKDPFQVTLQMKQGFLDPLALMNFKILPIDKRVNELAFAQNPVTSGPFLLGPHKSDEMNRECQYFLANPSYGLRPGKRDAPRIQEIRFYSYDSNTNLAERLGSGKFDLVLDLTAKEAEGLRKNPNANIAVPMPSQAAPNRRIYFLAINTRKLESVDLRQALSCAIDREALLNKHFRTPGKAPLHKALNGPFPAGSWACKPKSPALYSPDTAKLLKNHPAVDAAAKSGPWVLEYASDNPDLDEAMKDLAAQVKALIGVELEPRRCDPYQLREDVEHTKRYDLAYYHYDFVDESYSLAPLFGPPPGGEDDTNLFNKYHPLELTKLLDGTKNHRDFSKVQKFQREIHKFLNRDMPFIPLWQLDPLLAHRSEVKPAALDPLLVFGNIEEWRLQHK